MGGVIGTLIGRRITATELPQMVAALHSVVGLAAVLTGIGSVLMHTGEVSAMHAIAAFSAVIVGGVTFVSLVFFFYHVDDSASFSRPAVSSLS